MLCLFLPIYKSVFLPYPNAVFLLDLVLGKSYIASQLSYRLITRVYNWRTDRF